jgi:hypothetical protein
MTKYNKAPNFILVIVILDFCLPPKLLPSAETTRLAGLQFEVCYLILNWDLLFVIWDFHLKVRCFRRFQTGMELIGNPPGIQIQQLRYPGGIIRPYDHTYMPIFIHAPTDFRISKRGCVRMLKPAQ